MTRRQFLTRATLAGLGAAAGLKYSLMEAKWLAVNHVSLPVPNLPASMRGLRAVFMADFHHGPYVPLTYIKQVVEMANAFEPDIILLGGDYPHRGTRFIAPCIEELSDLRAPLGVYGILGNHDHYDAGQPFVTAALKDAGIRELTNRGTWVEAKGGRFWLCGVDDFWRGTQNLPDALAGTTTSDPVILLSHNPDYVEEIHDPRVGLVLSGHTHGGQVDIPFIGAPVVPSLYGQKYTHGLVQGPVTKVFVTRGIGTITPPVRFLCRPEIVVATLV